jgi:cell division protease FtsH
MVLVRRLLLPLLFLINSISIPYAIAESNNTPDITSEQVSPQPSEAEMREFQQAMVQAYEEVTTHDKKTLDEIYNVISGLSMMINDGQVSTVTNKKDITAALSNMSMIIHDLQQEQFMVVNPTTAALINELNNALMGHLLKAIDNDLQTLPQFELAEVLKRGHAKETSLESLIAQQQHNDRLLATLKANAEVVGLRWYNRAYRKFDTYVIAPTEKYSLHKWAIGLTGASAAALLIYWHYANTEDFDANPIVQRLPDFLTKTILGPKTAWEHGAIKNADQLKFLGRIEQNLYEANTGHMVVTAALASFTYDKISNFHAKTASPWLWKTLGTWHNTLKGGAYIKRAAQIQEKLDEVSFDDLVGLDEVKETFGEIVKFILDPEYYARRGQQPPKGILLVGKSRTGKSYSVSALATHIKKAMKAANRDDDFKYIAISASDIQEAGGVEELMRLVRSAAPCVLFIDEIDLLDLQRKGYNPMLMAFLTHMDGAVKSKDPKKQIILIGATTNPENLDKALRHDGRFEKELVFELPAYKERKLYLENKIRKLGLSPDFFDLDKIAHETEGKAYATLNRLMSRATLHACFENRVVQQADIEYMLDKEIRHIVMHDNKVVSDEDKLLIAAHFAGRAIVLNSLNLNEKLAKVTIRPVVGDAKEKMMGAHLWEQGKDDEDKRIEYGALFTYRAQDSTNIKTYQHKIDSCKVLLAGFIAEELLLGACGYDCHKSDMHTAIAQIQSLAFEGVNVDKLPESLQVEYHRKSFELLERCKQEVRALLRAQLPELGLITGALMEYEILDGDIVTMLCEASRKQREQPSAPADSAPTEAVTQAA